MLHLNITFPEDLKIKLDHEAKKEGTKRSTLIQRAVLFYLDSKEQKKKNNLLKEGYAALRKDAMQIMEDFKYADGDALKYVD